MKIKVGYKGMRIGGWEYEGEVIMELPDGNFVEQYNEFTKQMGELGEQKRFVDLRDTSMEIVKEEEG